MIRKGFSLVEVMVSVAIFTMMMLGVTTAFLAGRSAWEVNLNTTDVQAQARLALWGVAKDLRQAGVISGLPQTVSPVTFSFDHPAEGAVTYTWTRDTVTGVGNIVRDSSAWPNKTVARNISAFSLTENGSDVVISITAMHTSSTGKTDSMSLTEKVVKRL